MPVAAAPKITQYLIPSERHAIEVRHHWAYLGAAILATIGFWIGGLIALALTIDLPILRAMCVFFLLFSLCWLAWQITEWWYERFVVTDRRVLMLTGVLTRKVAVMPLAKVTDLTYERSIAGRLLGYGSFIIESAGQQQALRRIRFLPEPLALYHEVSSLLFGKRYARDDGTGIDPATGQPSPAIDDAATALWPVSPVRGQRGEQPTAPLPGVRG